MSWTFRCCLLKTTGDGDSTIVMVYGKKARKRIIDNHKRVRGKMLSKSLKLSRKTREVSSQKRFLSSMFN